MVQTTFSKSYVSQSVSLHDTTGRLRSGKCYLRSFPHFSFSSSARNSITMSTAPQQDLLTSAQPQSVVSNVLISVCSQPSSTSPPLSLYPAIPLCPLVTSLLLRLQFAVVVDPRPAYCVWHRYVRSAPFFGPHFASKCIRQWFPTFLGLRHPTKQK